MERILNSHTNTVHKVSADASHRKTQCGALTRVPDTRIERIDADAGVPDRSCRCGRCFPGNGGY